jgi:hypothetical protein
MFGIIGVDDAADALCESNDDRVDNPDFVHPSGRKETEA